MHGMDAYFLTVWHRYHGSLFQSCKPLWDVAIKCGRSTLISTMTTSWATMASLWHLVAGGAEAFAKVPNAAHSARTGRWEKMPWGSQTFASSWSMCLFWYVVCAVPLQANSLQDMVGASILDYEVTDVCLQIGQLPEFQCVWVWRSTGNSLPDTPEQWSTGFGTTICSKDWLDEGSRVYLDEDHPTERESLEVLHTPGHTPDSISLWPCCASPIAQSVTSCRSSMVGCFWSFCNLWIYVCMFSQKQIAECGPAM